jgi:hypothetical protein
MKTLQRARRPAALIGMVALLVLPAGCAVEGGSAYGPAVSVGVGLDYYEPFGFDYGGWGPGYNVGPPRAGAPRGGGAPGRGWRPAPPGRAMPSIPSAPPRGGARGGGKR